jgi:hypothetical protein
MTTTLPDPYRCLLPAAASRLVWTAAESAKVDAVVEPTGSNQL